MRTKITSSEKLQLLGLLTLGRSHQKIVDQVNDEMTKIGEADDNYSHLTDALYEDTDLDEVLSNMKIEVEDATA